MKKVLIFLTKFSLLILFIYNLGIFQYIADTEKHPPAPIKENGVEDLEWLENKYQNALNLEKNYGPKEYFSDITDIEIKRKNNDFSRRSLPAVNSTVTALANLFHENLSNYRFREGRSKKEVASYMKLVVEESEKCEEAISPGITERRKELQAKTSSFAYWLNLFKTFLNWIMVQYFKNLLPALILLWLWWYKEKETFRIKNPLSFLFCLIIYPIVIFKTIKEKVNNQARYLAMTAFYRQRQVNLFSLFSDNEIQEIRKYAASSISLKNYRENLSQRNLVIRHNFVLSFTISLLFIILNANKLNANYCELFDFNKLNQTEILQDSPPPYNFNTFVDFDYIFKDLFLNTNFQVYLKHFLNHIFLKNKCLKGVKQTIEHVPKKVVSNLNYISFNL